MDNRKPRSGVIGLCAIVLFSGALVQIIAWRAESEKLTPNAGVSLAQKLPPSLSGCEAHDEPIATTAEMKKAVGELLNFNEGVYRIYKLRQLRISVYVAWWQAGQMSPRLVGTHTPDVCWPADGWIRDHAAENGIGELNAEFVASGFPEGEVRVFVANGKKEYVVFWHKVGAEILSYKNGWAPPWWAWLDELWRGGLHLRQEQLFVRISSDQPLAVVWSQPDTKPLREALLELGLGGGIKPTH